MGDPSQSPKTSRLAISLEPTTFGIKGSGLKFFMEHFLKPDKHHNTKFRKFCLGPISFSFSYIDSYINTCLRVIASTGSKQINESCYTMEITVLQNKTGFLPVISNCILQFIYRYQCPCSEKVVYVGQTVRACELRWNEHGNAIRTELEPFGHKSTPTTLRTNSTQTTPRS